MTTPRAGPRARPWRPSPPGAGRTGSGCSRRTPWWRTPSGPRRWTPGGKGHRGRDGIGRFWDGNIGSVLGFRFRVADSFANGPCCANVVSITMTLDGGAVMTVDCVIVYTVDESGLITSLRAHWEPERALATLTAP
ncbi:nuclear transport factor 2 family protein [Planomonospora parontospora]|uniref:nuclear transport factor 2 family protein n=1 Tax=Planomonospora parontospora TaxID=58119 RepID=UPI00360D4698